MTIGLNVKVIRPVGAYAMFVPETGGKAEVASAVAPDIVTPSLSY
jgi:hypothetical protein